ncbi:alpha/beta hydrolase [Paenibacillus xylanilyticus]|uniref:alpha/beta fold hydrolase n=1 Tax=Paenibacillus xylanilyticus TaxID=248903 RepID=UPI002B1BD93A|nr:alpha/beta hydrolase [Paenibacillus xylanilyticus]
MGQYVQVEDKVKIYIEDIGQGVPVIFLHGWPANHLMFEYQYTLLASHGYRCIGMDIRGFGKSDAPWESYSYDRMADDLRAVIDELQLENAALVGFSMGGAIASRYMSRHTATVLRDFSWQEQLLPLLPVGLVWSMGWSLTK